MKTTTVALMATALAIAMNAQAALYNLDYSGSYDCYDLPNEDYQGSGAISISGQLSVVGNNAVSGSIQVLLDGTSQGTFILDPSGAGVLSYFTGDASVFPSISGNGLVFSSTLDPWDVDLYKAGSNYGIIFMDTTFYVLSEGGSFSLTEVTAAVPEPSTWLAGLGAFGMMAGMAWRSRKA